MTGFPCPCCGHLTLGEPPPGAYEVCPVCYWEDDGVQFADEDYRGGANEMSLKEARANYRHFGAVSRRFTRYVRKPFDEEIPGG